MNAGHAVVYAHHAQAEQPPAFVLAAIEGFLEVADHVVLVAAGIDALHLPEPLQDRVSVLCRPNRGWDFASYRDGIAAIGETTPTRITLCNDSVYGPLFSLTSVFDRIAQEGSDVWSMTASSELQWHLQSYFLSFGETALRSSTFREFWASVSDEAQRREVIRDGEVGLSQQLMKAGLTLQPLYELPDVSSDDGPGLSSRELIQRGLRSAGRRWRSADFYRDLRDVLVKGARPGNNPSLEQWSRLVAEQGLPLVKRSVLKGSPGALAELEAGLAANSQEIRAEVLQALREDLNA